MFCKCLQKITIPMFVVMLYFICNEEPKPGITFGKMV